jgi:hypothetical protein
MKTTALATLLSLCVLTPATAAYMPDNDGKFSWAADRQVQPQRRHHRHAEARKPRKSKKKVVDANGSPGLPWNMVRVRTVQGFYLTVHPAYAHKFLKLFEILEQNHVKVPKDLVGCYSRRGHVPGSNHYIGAACDIQTGWNRTIPALYHAGKWIRQAGLYDGCDFGDCGHIEGIKGTHNAKRVPNLYAALAKFKADEATANYQP